ncbi:MAG: nickel insertion protein [Anaerolineae bacterium]|jgi:uncharacterized protein (DUF111 family)
MAGDTTPARVHLLECNLDDMTGEALGHALERILAAGALDAWYTPIYAKKNRPAVVLSVLCAHADTAALTRLILTETSSLGVRVRAVERVICDRQLISVATTWGPVRCKVKLLDGEVLGIKPEYEDCAQLARAHAIPLERVLNAARQQAWRDVQASKDTIE